MRQLHPKLYPRLNTILDLLLLFSMSVLIVFIGTLSRPTSQVSSSADIVPLVIEHERHGCDLEALTDALDEAGR